jgi:cell division protein FtsQ
MSTNVMPRQRSGGAPRVEPKLQARRIEVARDQGRRRLRYLVLLATVVVLIVGAYALAQSPVLDVDQVTVSGANRTEAGVAREAAGIDLGRAMVSVDPGAAEARLEALPWVEQATVRRDWPGAVAITLVERTPVAMVGAASSAVLVDGDGRALGPADDDALPLVAGDAVEAGETIGADQLAVVAILADMPDELRAEVAEATGSASGTTLVLTDGIEVRWGDQTQSTAKSDALQVLLEQADRPTIDGIDVSVPRAATLTRND